MFIELPETKYECRECGSTDVIQRQGRNSHYYDHWQECVKCGHDNKPDRSIEAGWTGTSCPPERVKF
jgi:Zn ribbon nucleic-acid-binding protein